MKLYDVPKNSTIVLKEGIEMTFHHIDGAYSVCTDKEGNVYHISASEEVEVKPKEAKNDT